jgi:hypothetical protein
LFHYHKISYARANRPSAYAKLIKRSRKQSLLRTNKIATLDRALIKGLLERLDDSEIVEFNNKLRALLKLGTKGKNKTNR